MCTDTRHLTFGDDTQDFLCTVGIGIRVGVEEAETEFDHVRILRIETGHIEESHQITEFISLFETQFCIYPFFCLYFIVREYTDSTDILAGIFLGQRRITIALSETGPDKAVISQLVIQTCTEDRFDRYFSSEYLCVGFTKEIVHTIIFGTHTGRHAQAVEKALVILEEQGCIVAVVIACRYRGASHMFVSGSGCDLCTVVPFFVELVIQIIRIILVDGYRVSFRVDRIGQPRDQVGGTARNTTFHHP